ncbi:hypothetical protein [Metabacillus fastidiosus]|uniref:Uncharacterized protein n=1 Tax=Metabacillus fastidiosus TaxID=1458 RepID=A0ABU6NT21_9BACI|nr:hypothetical protein [Metabacillus fastidiosus]MED4400298.1 hypothetical protein [Metabacillus fastidiosus]
METPEIFSYDVGSNSAYINRSGNSDVDVVEIDTIPIAPGDFYQFKG